MEALLHYISILLRYRVLIILLTSVAAIGSVVFSIISLEMPPEESPLPNVYQAYAKLLMTDDSGTDSTQAMLAALGVQTGSSGGSDYGQIALEVLRSRQFVDGLVKEYDLIERYGITENVRSKSRQALLGKAGFDFDQQTGILTVSFEDIDPELAKEVTNSMVANLTEWFQSRGGSNRLQSLRSLENKLVEVEEEIARLQANIEEFQREHGVLRVEELAERQSTLLSSLQSRLVELDVQIRNYESISRMQNDPQMLRLQNERDNLLAQIREIESGYTGGARRMPARSELPELALRMDKLQTDLAIQQRIYQAVSEQYEVARLTAEVDPVFTVLELAEVPDEKAGPSRAQLCMQITGGALAASIILAFLINALRTVARDPEKRKILEQGAS
jgi:capsule polysaccharide export protein KpsE/RkpR